jgi:catechol 2,3-dioxygenase-like lactoylglutathione lyase family enzyme
MTERTLPVDAPAPTELNHVVMRSAHVAECTEFYGKLLGMKLMAGDGVMGAALSQDGEHHRLLLMGVAPGDPNHGPGVEHIAFKARSLEDLLGNYKRLKGMDILPYMAVHHGGTLSMYYLDPDGVQIEILIDTQPADLSIEMMNSPEFAKNPIGVPISFDDLCERYEAGDSIASLYAQPEEQEGDLEKLIEQVVGARGAPLQR